MENNAISSFFKYTCLWAICYISLSISNRTFAQFNFVERTDFTPKIDTLYSSHRSGGQKIDSLDKKFYYDFPTIFNVGRAYIPFFQPLKNWGSYRHFFSDERPIYRPDFHFTALPYTGIYYSFGSGGEQILDLRYTQNVGQNFNLSFQYHRTSSDLMKSSFLMRNIETQSNDISLNAHYHKNKINSFLSTYYSFNNQNENFGVDGTNPNLNNFLLQQIQVNNTIADVRIRRAQINLRNEFNIIKDSSQVIDFVSIIGIHHFQRRYRDSTNQTFINWIYNPTTTRDFWEEPHALFENGLQFKRKNWRWYGGFLFDYFTYINRDIRTSRLDGVIQSAFDLKTNRLSWKNNLRIFVLGTPGEYRINSKISYQLSKLWHLGGEFLQDRFFPEFFQIHYHGNHINYNYSSLQISPTTRIFIEPNLSFGEKKQLQFLFSYLNIRNLYTFQNENWNFNGNQNVLSTALSWNIKKGVFGWNGKAQYYLGTKDLLFAPDYLINTRLFFDGTLFAAKKLKVATGIEAQYFEGYKTMLYHPEIGVFGQYTGVSTLPQQKLILNAFVNLQMDRFRFFVAINRINTLFESKVGFISENYPIRPFFIRMGIVWDFVN